MLSSCASNFWKLSTDYSGAPERKRANWEEKLEQLIDELKEINGENYRFAQLTMWARMIESQQWDSNKKLPPAAMICGSCSKEKPNSWDTTASALTNAAVTFVP